MKPVIIILKENQAYSKVILHFCRLKEKTSLTFLINGCFGNLNTLATPDYPFSVCDSSRSFEKRAQVIKKLESNSLMQRNLTTVVHYTLHNV